MTLKVSTDEASSWPEPAHTLYDSRNGSEYSCLSPMGNEHVGILYEGPHMIYFLRIPIDELVTGNAALDGGRSRAAVPVSFKPAWPSGGVDPGG